MRKTQGEVVMNKRSLHISSPVAILLVSAWVLLLGIIIGKAMKYAQDDAFCDHLWSAADSGEYNRVKKILDKGIDPDCQCGIAMKRAKQAGQKETIQLLKRYGAKG